MEDQEDTGDGIRMEYVNTCVVRFKRWGSIATVVITDANSPSGRLACLSWEKAWRFSTLSLVELL